MFAAQSRVSNLCMYMSHRDRLCNNYVNTDANDRYLGKVLCLLIDYGRYYISTWVYMGLIEFIINDKWHEAKSAYSHIQLYSYNTF